MNKEPPKNYLSIIPGKKLGSKLMIPNLVANFRVYAFGSYFFQLRKYNVLQIFFLMRSPMIHMIEKNRNMTHIYFNYLRRENIFDLSEEIFRASNPVLFLYKIYTTKFL
jgi:hypothetical protein